MCLVMVLTGCSEADKVNYNMSQQAQYFECERRITVYNARTDLVILYAEGYAEECIERVYKRLIDRINEEK